MDKQQVNQGRDNIVKNITKNKSARLVAILVATIVIGLILIFLGAIKVPLSPTSITTILQKKPTVQLKTEYNNPFAKETQYVNPFEKYKNPFVVSR
jgi:predicted PurR-regulated permease PerM